MTGGAFGALALAVAGRLCNDPPPGFEVFDCCVVIASVLAPAECTDPPPRFRNGLLMVVAAFGCSFFFKELWRLLRGFRTCSEGVRS